MSTFTLAISCFITSNLPWFMGLTFQVPMQYCSLRHRTLLLSPVTSTGCCFCFGSVSSFFLELFLYWSPVAYWAPTNLGSSSFSVLSFCLFILFMGFSRQKHLSGLPFPSPVDHILSELFTMTHPTWVALHNMAHSFIELDKAVFCDCGFQSVCPLMEKDKRLLKASWWHRLGILGLVLMGGAMLNKSLIQFSVDGWSCVPSLLFEVKWSEVTQSCLTLCNPMDSSQPGSSIHGIFQARILEWVAISCYLPGAKLWLR